jgi:2-polyprenyl-3-methyl-5-hydroxy-6-metoxy-1,4-benzoquinol methylase
MVEPEGENTNIALLPEHDPLRQEHVYRYERAGSFVYGRVLDVACGWGYGSEILRRNAASVIGMDRDEEAISFARENYPLVAFRHCGIETVEFEKVDCIVTIETVEHLEEPLKFVNKIQKAATLIFISTPIVRSTHWNPYHLHDFTLQEVMCWFLEWDLIYIGFQESSMVPGFYMVLACFKKKSGSRHPDDFPG